MTTADLLLAVADLLAAEPTPAPEPGGGIINTPNIMGFIAQYIAPIIFAAIGIFIATKIRTGQLSDVMRIVVISGISAMFIIGGGSLFWVGDDIANLIFG